MERLKRANNSYQEGDEKQNGRFLKKGWISFHRKKANKEQKTESLDAETKQDKRTDKFSFF